MVGIFCNICMVDKMTQVLIDRTTLEQLVRMLEQCLDDAIEVQCDLEQGYQKSRAVAQAKQVELSKESLAAGRAALAGAERVEPDTQRLNWLGQNFYSRENLDFITGRPSKTHTMWVFFAPIKVQGDIRRVLDAAKDE